MASEPGIQQLSNQLNIPKVPRKKPKLEPLGQFNNLSGPVAWGADPGSLIPETDPYLDAPKPASSLASHSSVINDYGDTKDLEENRKSSHSRPSRGFEVSTDGLVAHLGSGFPNDFYIPKSGECNIFIPDGTAPLQGSLGDELENHPTEEETLGESIRAAFEVSRQKEQRSFLPLDALEKIVTSKRIRKELETLDVVLPERLDYFTDKIWRISYPSPTTKTTRRKIFAILALIEKVEKIVDFIQEDLHDSDLPFVLSCGSRRGLRQFNRKDGEHEMIQLFSSWRTHDLESFDHAQWQFLVPYFHLSTKEQPKVLHYNLHNQIILPFTEDNEVCREGGGFGDVWKVVIHPAHHNYCDDSVIHNENPPYAVKRLRTNNYDAFNAEVSSLKLFSTKDHLHLIKLLVTFSWHDQYYLLFPWADGNLLDFWKLYPNPSEPKRDYQLAFWVCEQLLGIAEGVKMIHTADKPVTGDSTHDSTHHLHGRHGDLKPENILWFKQYLKDPREADQSCHLGVLKISDFGLTRFHGTMSRSRISAGGIPVSPTYRAPEYDVAKMVSQSYDIWTLGCVILEFITWYLLGWEAVARFSQKRVDEDNSEIKEDVFFNFVSIRDESGRAQTGAKAKQSVLDAINTLLRHDNCSDFLMDLLIFVRDKMLRLGPKKRADCKEIVENFTELHSICRKKPDYCTKRSKKLPTRTGTSSSLLQPSALDLSPAMDRIIKSEALPAYTGPLENDHQTPESESSRMGMNTLTEAQTLAPIAVAERSKTNLTATGSTAEPESPLLQSSNRKVHFETRLQSPCQDSFKPNSFFYFF